MKLFVIFTVFLIVLLAGCDVQSGISKKSVEKYAATPTPAKTQEVVEQIDPADIVTADTTVDGPPLSINRVTSRPVDCTKYNRVSVNLDQMQVKVNGVCKQLILNGDRIRVEAAAVSEIVLNGGDNTVKYSKYVNGKKPVVHDNGGGNLVEKGVATEAAK